tara:strand:- start:13549 stop:14109 length:561 start_codon:yes stop_codon:yes gene_type:complete
MTLKNKDISDLWVKVMCSCGKEKVASVDHVNSGHTKSCGCLNGRPMGHTLEHKRMYAVWANIKARCFSKTNKQYVDYGGRGITLCDDWKNSFLTFYRDIGPRPSKKHSVDRIDNNGPYSPENCRWATGCEQQNNTRKNVTLTYKGKTMTVANWSRACDIKASVLYARKKKGWSDERALTDPIRKWS